MNRTLAFIFILSFVSCYPSVEDKSPYLEKIDNTLSVPNEEIDKSELDYNPMKSQYFHKGVLYSGYAISKYPEGVLKEKIGIVDGKKQNESTLWYRDGHTKLLSTYHKGKLHGERKSWSSDSTHTLVSHLNYYLGKAHGEQKKWYSTGEIFKKLNLNMGKEEGIQQAFRKNGDLYANYEAREGRIFGMKKAALCFGLENENVQFEK